MSEIITREVTVFYPEDSGLLGMIGADCECFGIGSGFSGSRIPKEGDLDTGEELMSALLAVFSPTRHQGQLRAEQPTTRNGSIIRKEIVGVRFCCADHG